MINNLIYSQKLDQPRGRKLFVLFDSRKVIFKLEKSALSANISDLV